MGDVRLLKVLPLFIPLGELIEGSFNGSFVPMCSPSLSGYEYEDWTKGELEWI
jgi:hypothetical protein